MQFLPLVPTSDGVGQVVAVGEGVTRAKSATACSAPSIKVGSQAATRRSRSRAGLLPPEGLADYGRCATVRDETGPVKGPPALVQQAMKEIVVVDHIGATPRKF
jgi:hypothetical protein